MKSGPQWEKITHLCRSLSAPQNFLLAFIDELWKTWKIRILKKWIKKLLEISSFYTCVPKATIIWSTVPEIQSWTEFFYHFGPFFALYIPPDNPENQNFEKMKKSFWRCHHFKLVQQKTQSYDVCLLRYGRRRHNFLLF